MNVSPDLAEWMPRADLPGFGRAPQYPAHIVGTGHARGLIWIKRAARVPAPGHNLYSCSRTHAPRARLNRRFRMSTNAKTLKRLAQEPGLKAARDKLTQMSPNERKAALRISAARTKKQKEKK
jgi:hypothetical protein